MSRTSTQRSQNHVPPLKFRADVQGIRAIAVIGVVVFHSGLGFSGGYLGVDVFFVISGFVIGRLLTNEIARTGKIRFSQFYARRVRRLLPALCLVLGFVAIGSIFIVNPLGGMQQITATVGIAASVYLANVALLIYPQHGYFDVSNQTNPLLHTWTLGVEEQFYLLLPLLLLAASWGFARARERSRTQERFRSPNALLLWILMLASFSLNVVLTTSWFGHIASQKQQDFAFYMLPARAWEFLVGVLIARWSPLNNRISKYFGPILMGIGIILILASFQYVNSSASSQGLLSVPSVVGTAILIWGGSSTTRNRVSRLLQSKAMVWLGDRSYGWYLWHWPFIVFVRTSFPEISRFALFGVALLSLVPTWASYRYLEQPIRLNSHWTGARAVRLAAVCASIPIALFISGQIVARPFNNRIVIAQDAAQVHLDIAHGCSSYLPNDTATYRRCTWIPPHSTGHIYLLGDSLAGALSNVMRDVATSNHVTITVATFDGCPFADIEIVDTSLGGACLHFVRTWTNYLDESKPALVVVTSRDTGYVEHATIRLWDPVSGRTGTTAESRAAIYQAGLQRTLGAFNRHGVPVALIASPPDISPFDVRECASWRLYFDQWSCKRSMSLEAANEVRARALEATKAAVATAPSTTLIDFSDFICPERECSAVRYGTWLYRDGAHLSVPGAAKLAPDIVRKVLPLAGRRATQ